MKQYRLTTINWSHYCERARWALDRSAIPYDEDAHLPGLHGVFSAIQTRRSTGTPNAVTPSGKVLRSSDIILQHLWANHDSAKWLYPSTEARTLESKFEGDFGVAARAIAYFYVLPERDMMVKTGKQLVTPTEHLIYTILYWRVAQLVLRALRVTPAVVESSMRTVRETFDMVSELLADGRRYLTGDHFTAADLTFASLAAPVIFPENYGIKFPPQSELPEELQALVRELRATRAGAFVLRMYAEERGVNGSARVVMSPFEMSNLLRQVLYFFITITLVPLLFVLLDMYVSYKVMRRRNRANSSRP